MEKDENGYIVVETIGAFLLLVLLMLSILSLVNIVTVQTRVHYALTQAAETVSMYSYVLDVTGAADHLMKNAEQAEAVQGEIDTFTENVNQVLDGIRSLSIDQVKDNGKKAGVQVQGWINGTEEDPKRTIQYLLNYGLNKAENTLFSELMRPLVGHYLSNGNGIGKLSGNEYLKMVQVDGGLDGLDFSNGFNVINPLKESTLLDSKGYIWLRVTYKIDYTFGALPLPWIEPALEVTQTVATKAWLGGAGEGYKP